MFGKDFLDLLKAFDSNDVRYLVVGGYAVAFYGHPRYTKDLDIWVEASLENARRIIQAIQDFGFGSLDLTLDDFSIADRVVQIGHPPHRVDILTSADGVEFTDCYTSRVETDVEGTPVNFISLDHLKRNKAASGRQQDRADLKALGGSKKRDGRRATDR